MLPPGTRFAQTKVWTIDINEYGSQYFELYHVVSSTPKSLMVLSATLFGGDVHVDGNVLMDKILDARATNTPLLNQSTTPCRYMLKKDHRGDYFVVGTGTASRRVSINGTHPVTYIAHGNKDEANKGARKRSRVEANTSRPAHSAPKPHDEPATKKHISCGDPE